LDLEENLKVLPSDVIAPAEFSSQVRARRSEPSIADAGLGWPWVFAGATIFAQKRDCICGPKHHRSGGWASEGRRSETPSAKADAQVRA